MKSPLFRYLLLLALAVLSACDVTDNAGLSHVGINDPETGDFEASNKVGGDFALTDHNGQAFNLKQLRGKVVLLFFGYTSCPDVCPRELTDLAMIFNNLNENADKVQGVFITVDPERDTQEILKEYVAFFSKSIIGLSGSLAEIDRITQQYSTTYQLNKREGENYSVDHSANLYVINKEGKIHAVVPYGFPLSHVQKMVDSLIEQSNTYYKRNNYVYTSDYKKSGLR